MRNCFPGTLLFLLFFMLLLSRSEAQLQPGYWNEHLPYYQAKEVVDAGDKIYCATDQGLFFFDKTDNSLEKITRIQGLSDVGVSTIFYLDSFEALIVAYTNSNIDLIKGSTIVNVPDIRNKIMAGNKTINRIYTWEDRVYLACGFGIVVFDPEREEIQDTYLIGEEGTKTNVFDILVKNDTLFAATEKGIFRAGVNDPFLADYARWSKWNNLPDPNGTYSQLLEFNEDLFVLLEGVDSNPDQLFQYRDGNWIVPDFYEPSNYRRIWADDEMLMLTRALSVEGFNRDLERVYLLYQYNFGTMDAFSSIRDSEGFYWIADRRNGLVRSNEPWHAVSILPNGPFRESAFNFAFGNNTLYVAGGSKDQSLTQTYSNAGFYTYKDGWWTNFNRDLQANFPDYLFDLTEIIVDPNDPTHVFAGSWGCGLLEFRNDELVEVYNDTNSTLQSILPGFYVRIGGMAYDRNGYLWISNAAVDNILSVVSPDGEWTALPYGGTTSRSQTGRVVIDSNNFKWVILPAGEGLFVLNDSGTPSDLTDDEYKKITVRNEEGEVVNDIFSLAVDRDGLLWIGTNQGVLVYYATWSVFTEASFQANRIIVNLDGTPQPLLGTETINAIAIDGANRKWFGTQSGGVVLMSADGTTQLEQFTTANSPLLSNTILQLAIDPQSGEVFIASDKGISSYRGFATEPELNFTQVSVYPNPVRPNYEGNIVIKGTIEQTQAKITDIAGNVVFSTESLGGQAIWDGRDFSGNKVATGVYLVYMTNFDGSKTAVTKLLFVK